MKIFAWYLNSRRVSIATVYSVQSVLCMKIKLSELSEPESRAGLAIARLTR